MKLLAIPLLLLVSDLTNAHTPEQQHLEKGNNCTLNLNVQLFSDDVNRLLNTDLKGCVVAQGYSWLEGPVWDDKQQCLLFSDIPSHRVLQYCENTGTNVYLNDSAYSNGLAINQNNELVLMQSRTRRVAKMSAPLQYPSANYLPIVQNYKGKRLNSPNDLALADEGSIYFTDPPYGLAGQLDDPEKELSFQGVYRIKPDGSLSLQDKSIKFPNGIVLIDGGKAIIVAESNIENPVWYIYDVDDNGNLENRRLFAKVANYDVTHSGHGLPDGLKQHSSGYIFATGPGGIWVFSRDGDLLAHIGIDRPVANLAFNSDESFLYLTAQDRLIKIPL